MWIAIADSKSVVSSISGIPGSLLVFSSRGLLVDIFSNNFSQQIELCGDKDHCWIECSCRFIKICLIEACPLLQKDDTGSSEISIKESLGMFPIDSYAYMHMLYFNRCTIISNFLGLPRQFHFPNNTCDNSCITQPKWTKAEKTLLVDTVKNLPVTEVTTSTDKIDWTSISSLFKDHSPIDCLIQYRNVIDPNINNSPWTRQEETKLIELCVKYNEHNWCQIAEDLDTNRTPIECLRHYQQSLNKSIIKSDDWSLEEDEILHRAVELYGLKAWQHVANTLPGRMATQCVRRYRKICTSGLESGKWTELQERRLVLAVLAYPVCLNSSSSSTSSFSETATKDIHHHVSPLPSPEEQHHSHSYRPLSVTTTATATVATVNTQRHTAAAASGNGVVPYFGWSDVADLVPGKDEDKCREKWANVLDPMVDRSDFRPEEDEILLTEVTSGSASTTTAEVAVAVAKAVAEDDNAVRGLVSWTKVAAALPGRTDYHVWVRWKQLQGDNDNNGSDGGNNDDNNDSGDDGGDGRLVSLVWFSVYEYSSSVIKYKSESRKRQRIVPSKLGRRCASGKVSVEDFDLVLRTADTPSYDI
eukprot:gene1317-2535_t